VSNDTDTQSSYLNSIYLEKKKSLRDARQNETSNWSRESNPGDIAESESIPRRPILDGSRGVMFIYQLTRESWLNAYANWSHLSPCRSYRLSNLRCLNSRDLQWKSWRMLLDLKSLTHLEPGYPFIIFSPVYSGFVVDNSFLQFTYGSFNKVIEHWICEIPI